MKLGLVGPGRHGSRYLQERNGGRYFTRVLSRTPRTDLPEWVKGTTDPEEFFAPGLDGVVIATPTLAHFALAMGALERGLHVLCEKPLAPVMGECELLTHVAELHQLRLLVAHTDLFHSQFPQSNGREVDSIYIRYGGPGACAEWAPHAVAAAVACIDDEGLDSIQRFGEGHLVLSYSSCLAHLLVSAPGSNRYRRVHVRWEDGAIDKFDGTAPSEPSPIRNMLDVFTSGKEDRRMSYDFTRAVYRVLLTDPD